MIKKRRIVWSNGSVLCGKWKRVVWLNGSVLCGQMEACCALVIGCSVIRFVDGLTACLRCRETDCSVWFRVFVARGDD